MVAKTDKGPKLLCNRNSLWLIWAKEVKRIFIHQQRSAKTASPCVDGGRGNQADVSNVNTIFTLPATPANLEEDQAQQDFNEVAENEFNWDLIHL